MPRAQSKSGTKRKSPMSAAEKSAAAKKDAIAHEVRRVNKEAKQVQTGPEPVYIVQRTIGYAYGGNQVIMMHVYKDAQEAADMVKALNTAVQDLLGHPIENFEGRTVADAYKMVGMESVTHAVYPSTVAQAPSKIIT